MGEWDRKNLGEINSYKGKSVNPMDTPDTTYELYSVPSWDNHYPEIIKGSEIGSTKQIVEKGDVLLCKINPRINRVWVVEQYTEHPLIASSEWIIVRNKEIHGRYLLHYFQSPIFQDMMVSEQSGIGGSLTRAQPKRVSTYPIPLPPLPVQQQIADVLDRASALIEKRKAQIEKLDLLVKSQFVEMFGDPVVNPMGWEIKALGDSCEIITGNTPPRTHTEYYGDFIEWIKTDNIIVSQSTPTPALESLSEQGFGKCRYVEANSILMTCIAGSLKTIGNVAITDRRVAFNQQINALTPLDYDHVFLYHLLIAMKEMLCGSVNMMLKGILSKGRLSEIGAIIPPLDLQNRFAVFVEAADKSKFEMRGELARLEILYKSLMQKCFKGGMIS